jgi:hypothetical protein
VDKAMAALRPSAGDGATSNCMVNVADKGAKENTEERGSDIVQEDKEQTAGGLHGHCRRAGATAIHWNCQLQMYIFIIIEHYFSTTPNAPSITQDALRE